MTTQIRYHLVEMIDCNNDAVLNKEECTAVIFVFKHNIICFLTAVSYTELYNLFNIYVFVDFESE